jgi:hypothetical protein
MISRTDRLQKCFRDNHVPVVHNNFVEFIDELLREARSDARQNGYKATFHANPKLVYDTVISTYTDIARHKTFHFDNPRDAKSDAVKRAAYFTKWIIRFRPIQVVLKETLSDPLQENEAPMFLNEYLAIEWAIGCIAIDAGLSGLKLRNEARTNLLYDLHFRELGEDGLLAVYRVMSDLAKAKLPNPMIEFPVT